MTAAYFEGIDRIECAGPDSDDALSFRWYDAERVVGDKTMADEIGTRMEDESIGLLWATADLFGHRRPMGGAATAPDQDVFAHAAAQVCHALDVTHRLGDENHMLWDLAENPVNRHLERIR